jgi:hypothetical protein
MSKSELKEISIQWAALLSLGLFYIEILNYLS